jgi:WD40 repeat protein
MFVTMKQLLFSLLPPQLSTGIPSHVGFSATDGLGSMNGNRGIASVCFLGPYRTTTDPDLFENGEEQCLSMLKSRTRIATTNWTCPSLPSASTSTAVLSPEHSLGHQLLASCQYHGNAHIWDLSLRRISCPILPVDDSRFDSPGLSIQRLQDTSDSQFMYQTRDALGSISLHDLQHSRSDSTAPSIIYTLHSYSPSFCSATAHGPANILAYPSQDTQHVELRDLRTHPLTSQPIAQILGAPNTTGSARYNKIDIQQNSNIRQTYRGHGMVTSLALCLAHPNHAKYVDVSQDPSCGTLVLACGMESGYIFYHDLRMLGGNREKDQSLLEPSNHDTTSTSYPFNQAQRNHIHPFPFTSLALGNTPILSIDMTPSTTNTNMLNRQTNQYTIQQNLSSTHDDPILTYPFVSIAGMAADKDTLSDLPEDDRGTVAIIKGSVLEPRCNVTRESNLGEGRLSPPNPTQTTCTNKIVTRIRARVGTCRFDEHDGKPGVNICRFHPLGHMFAVGGWDGRIRLYSRTSARPLAVLKESSHSLASSITALDWSTPISFPMHPWNDGSKESIHMSLLASGTAEGRICLWNAFPIRSREPKSDERE